MNPYPGSLRELGSGSVSVGGSGGGLSGGERLLSPMNLTGRSGYSAVSDR